jgi:carbon storage regulator
MKYGKLVLQRAPGERILIGHDVVVEVHSIQNKRVRLTIIAPKNMHVIREEISEGGFE